MLFGMAAASSALDLINSLVQRSGSTSSKGQARFSAPSDASQALPSTTSIPSDASAQGGRIAPDTMNALLAAQGQSNSGQTTSTSRADALKNLFNTLDADGSGGISKSEFENALGAGGTNTANADSVFDKLDTDGDGSVSASELSTALRGKHHAHGPKGGGGAGKGEDALMQAIDGANATTTSNSDGSTTSTVSYADGSTVTMTTPAASSSSTTATRSYNAIEQMLQQQVNALTKGSSVSSSVSVSA